MLEILTITSPFFLIIFLGSFLRKLGWFTEEHGRTLARFAFFVVLPPFMFVSITSSSITQNFSLTFLLQYEISTILLFLTAAIIGRKILRLEGSAPSMFALNSTMPNYGYIGVPLCLLAFGKNAALPMALILVADTIVLLTLAAIVAAQQDTHSLKDSLLNMIFSMVRNPLLISVLIAFLTVAMGFELPNLLHLLLETLAGAAAPTALFALGVTLVGQPILSVRLELSLLVFFKLLIHPFLTAVIFLSWPMLGFEITDVLWIKVAILFSCLPIAANVYALSHFYGSYSGRTATAIMFTTILASITVPMTLFLLNQFLKG